MMQKLLTVVIPTYNMEKYLHRCLDSLLVPNEQMQLLEVLVVNDGSKDSSSEIAHEYEAKFPETFRVIDKENGNYGSCVNSGLAEATGKYIKILDADDWFENVAFVKYLDAIKDLDVDLVLNERVFVRPSGEVVKRSVSPFPESVGFDFFPSKELPVMHCVAYKTENLRKIGYRQTEGISYTDRQWVFTPISTVKKAFFVRENLYMYLVGREGQTMTPATMLRNMSHQTKGLYDMLSVYSENSYSGNVAVWMKARLKRWILILYRDVLIGYGDYRNSALIEMDDYLKENCREFYEESDNIVISKKIPYHYVRNWRRNRLTRGRHILIDFYRTYRRLIKKSPI